MSSNDNVKSKYRHFMLLLYPDDIGENHKSVIESLSLYDSVWILHDKDTDKNGEIKKPHIHAILSFVNPRYESALAKELNIDERWIEPIRDLKQSLSYLIHSNDTTKYQYSIDEVHGNVDKLRKTLILRRHICIILYTSFVVKNTFSIIKLFIKRYLNSMLHTGCVSCYYTYCSRGVCYFRPELDRRMMLMSTYEEFTIIIAVVGLFVAILNLKNR